MTSVDEEQGERQDDEDDEYEYVHVNGEIFDTIEAANRLQEAVTQLGGAQRLQQHLAAADRLARGPAYEVQRQMQQMQDFIDPSWQRALRQQQAMMLPAFDLQRQVQQMQDFVDPPYMRWLREQETMYRRLNGLPLTGRWIRVRRPRHPESPPPPPARKVEPEPEPRKTRGRPRRTDVMRLTQIEALAQKVREYRQKFRGVDPTKAEAARRLRLKSASTIDNWLRKELRTSWTKWLTTLA